MKLSIRNSDGILITKIDQDSLIGELMFAGAGVWKTSGAGNQYYEMTVDYKLTANVCTLYLWKGYTITMDKDNNAN